MQRKLLEKKLRDLLLVHIFGMTLFKHLKLVILWLLYFVWWMGRKNHQWDTFMKPWIGLNKLLKRHLIMIGGNRRVFEIIDKRWDDQLHQPLHAAGHILNPGLFYTNNENKTLDLNVWKGYHACVAKLVPDEAMQDKIGQVLGVYMQADGILGLASAIRGRTKLAPVEWWMQFGYEVPNLQQFAIRVQSLTCSSSGCERNWSVYEHIHTKKRNRLELKKLNDLVFVKYNRTLARRYKARNIIDPILLDNIDEANEWLTGGPGNHEEEVFEGEGLTFGHVAMTSGVEENVYGFRGSTLRSKERVSTSTSTCKSRTLINEASDEEEDDDD
ncbi:uncharacterized protein [Nicotiana sylvestris]|uniref:uncharacterized protein isoform X1 n=1 Tax=Nicotiana sylvestris TaxID=4096 RepID=UPI00388C3879